MYNAELSNKQQLTNCIFSLWIHPGLVLVGICGSEMDVQNELTVIVSRRQGKVRNRIIQ